MDAVTPKKEKGKERGQVDSDTLTEVCPQGVLGQHLGHLLHVGTPPHLRVLREEVVSNAEPHVVAHLVQLTVDVFGPLQVLHQVGNKRAVCQREELVAYLKLVLSEKRRQ